MDDLISRQWLMECVNKRWIKFDTEKDENRFIHLVRDIAPSAQPEPCEDAVSRADVEIEIANILRHVFVEYQDIARKTASKLPSVTPKAEQRWIPVTEQLPENIRPVIVTWKNTDPASYYRYIVGKRFIGVAHYKSGKWYWYSSTTEDFLAEYGRYDGEEFDEAIEVLAWRELPEPWKEGEANG